MDGLRAMRDGPIAAKSITHNLQPITLAHSSGAISSGPLLRVLLTAVLTG